MTTEVKDRMITEVMDDFDFDKVDKIMRQLGWKWAVGKYMATPGVYGLKQTSLNLLSDAISVDDGTSIETGGLRASWNGEELKLEFILETCISLMEDEA